MSKLKKFYRHAEVIEHPESDFLEKLKPEEKVTYNNLSKTHGPYWGVALDGRPIKTIYKERMAVPSRAIMRPRMAVSSVTSPVPIQLPSGTLCLSTLPPQRSYRIIARQGDYFSRGLVIWHEDWNR